MFTLHLFFLYINSQCPRYSMSTNPDPFIPSINLAVVFTNNNHFTDNWPPTITVHCSPATLTASSKSWHNDLPVDYTNKNESAVLNLKQVLDFKIRERPTCLMATNNNLCFTGTPYPLYFPEVTLLVKDGATVQACNNQQFALRVFDVPANIAPFIMWRYYKNICDDTESYFFYDTLYIHNIDRLTSALYCVIFGYSFTYNIQSVLDSPNCLGPYRRIMFPRQNDVLYYYQHKFYHGPDMTSVDNLDTICLPLRMNILLLDSNYAIVESLQGLSGSHQFSCMYSKDYYNPTISTNVTFTIVFPRPPVITVPLQDCIRCDNNCSFSFDYSPGDSGDPVTVSWFFNGKMLEEGFYVKFSKDLRSLSFFVFEKTGGNIQAVISNSYGTQMTSAYVVHTAPPFFGVDLPRYGTMGSSTTIFSARVNFTGQDKVKMWWKMDGKIMDAPVKHVTPTVDESTHTCTLTLDFSVEEPVSGTFSCVFQAGSCLVESTKCDFSTTEKIQATVSLMIPVLGVLGAAVLLAIVLIPLCVVYRNRHSKAYRLALVEREWGLNPDKDFQTINDFGENSRRQARNNTHFSILPSAPGSNDGSVLPFNNMPDIKEQASFVNDYQP